MLDLVLNLLSLRGKTVLKSVWYLVAALIGIAGMLIGIDLMTNFRLNREKLERALAVLLTGAAMTFLVGFVFWMKGF